MKKWPITTIILVAIITILAGALIGTLLYVRNQPPTLRGVAPLVTVAAQEPDSAQWGLNFPNEYSTYLQTTSNNSRTAYGGSEPYSKLEADPRLVQLLAGYSFSKDYNEERGHGNSLIDVRATQRVNEKTPGTCYSCKSSDNPRLWSELGMAEFDDPPFATLGERITNPIGCANCHEAMTMKLIVTNPALEAALAAQGKDWRTFTRQEMR
ncbi:MAG: ammonia-forming cytochrome c nitrite reductase subunit c552, partial [Chloroflexi bacterium]|nr:ammonia-forming cytochrome c nitrite reductase subunit c552 [Chloroflexota bacterium]